MATPKIGLEVLLALLVTLIVIGGFIYGGFVNMADNQAAQPQAKISLQAKGYTISQEPYNSSKVLIETTNDYNYFLRQVPVGTTLYERNMYPAGFVNVINSTIGLAYTPQYKSITWWIW
jgi:hypothetical protein